MSERPAAIVTGSSRGIGKAIAVELARLGYDIVLNHSSRANPQSRETQQEIELLDVGCVAVQADVGSDEGRGVLIDQAKSHFGRCDLLVNNAGAAPQQRVDILGTTQESYDRVLAINLAGPFFLSQRVANWMIEQKEAYPTRDYRIVNVGSISAYTSSPSRGEYCISKAGLGMVTALFADRLAEYGIGVFEIRPGLIETEMTQPVKSKYDKMIAEGLTPIKRWGKPEDVGAAVRAIAEGRLDFSTGQVINVDGGFHLKRL